MHKVYSIYLIFFFIIMFSLSSRTQITSFVGILAECFCLLPNRKTGVGDPVETGIRTLLVKEDIGLPDEVDGPDYMLVLNSWVNLHYSFIKLVISAIYFLKLSSSS